MNQQNNSTRSAIKFHATQPYQCSYFPDKKARAQIALPDYLINYQTYGQLIHAGFRRSGAFTYRPACETCHACIAVRIVANKFSPNRAQRRTWKRHQQLIATWHSLYFNPLHFTLYQRYQRKRHSCNGTDNDTQTQYQEFLLQSNVQSRLVEFHEDGQLRMISIIDKLAEGLSSVYTFFDPDITNASYGTYSILWQIEQCRKLNLPYVYLGYWIKNNRKMRYKSCFQPLEMLIDSVWKPYTKSNIEI